MDLVGQTLDGRYRVDERLGSGAMGMVFKAQHIALGQPVALKILLTERACEPAMIERFVAEARRSFRMDHPNCVRVTDFGATDDGLLFLVMDYLDGRTLAMDLAVDGPLSEQRTRHVAKQILGALDHAHTLGIIHRDLKLENIMLVQRRDDSDVVKVFDFGLAKLFDTGVMLTGLTLIPKTQDGMVFGTPTYMSPEQALGDLLTPAADIYALGICCYEMLTGTVPFEGAFMDVLTQHIQNQPLPPSHHNPRISSQLDALVMSCLEKDATQRPSASELLRLLEETESQHSGRSTSRDSMSSSETQVMSQSSLVDAQNRWRVIVPSAFAIAGIVIAILFWPSSEVDIQEHPKVAMHVAIERAPTAAPAVKEPAFPTIDAGTHTAIQASPDAGIRARTDAGAKRASRKRASRHLAAAESAFRRGNLVKQLTEASAALKAQPRNRRAALLTGDALLRSGDKVRACRYFKRSSKKRFRAADC